MTRELPFKTHSPKEAFKHLNILIYGHAGTGKTVFTGSAGACPETSPLLLLDAEAGSKSIYATLGDVDVSVRPIDNFTDDIGEVFQYLSGSGSDDSHPFRSVAWDSCTELQKRCMSGIMRQSLMTKPEHDPDVPEMLDWMRNQERMRKALRYYRDLPMTFIVTCLAHRDKDETTGRVMTMPELPGKLAGEVPGYFDIVGYLTASNTEDGIERRMHVQPSGNFVAKDRTNALPPVVVNPTISMIYDLIAEKHSE